MIRYNVTVIIKELNFRKTYFNISAKNEWEARSKAMIKYNGPNINGKFVEYKVTKIEKGVALELTRLEGLGIK